MDCAPRPQAWSAPRQDVWPFIKRVFDLLMALIAVVALIPLLLLIALAIKLDSRGPVLFRQPRLGRALKPFTVLKFRTMEAGARPDLHRAYIAKLASGAAESERLKKLTGDPRVTRVGRLLRRTSLDELPQLLNILLGRMSLVGPRPGLDYELEHYDERHYDRFAVKPGLTGLWQVSGRSQLGFREMLDLDVEYARGAGPLLDLKILLKTPFAAFKDAA